VLVVVVGGVDVGLEAAVLEEGEEDF